MNGIKGKGKQNMSSIEDVIHFFEMEICQTKQWLDDKNMSPIFNGVNVGFKEAKLLMEHHIWYCQNIIDRIRRDCL